MTRRRWFRGLGAVLVAACTLALSSILSAQGQSDEGFERVREVQERHTERMLARPGVVGTAVGLDDDGRHVVLILLEKDNVPDIPADLDGIPVRRMVTGTIYALPKPPATSKIPAAPSNLAATAAGTTQINLTWKDNATNETGFKIERGTGVSYTQIATVGANITSYSNTGLSASTPYSYRVRAYNKSGNSAYSNIASATTAAPTSNPPAIPTALAATAVSSTQINLDWADNAAGDQVSRYDVYRSPTSGSGYVKIGSATASNYSDTGLTAATTYYYAVTATNAIGSSDYSGEASATTQTVPTPTDPTDRFPRPVPTGVSTGHPSITAGTISCRVTNGTTLYVLSNNHVYAASNQAGIGDGVIQPGYFDGGRTPADDIARLSAFKVITWSNWPFITYNTVDAAIAEIILDNGVPRVGNATPSAGYGTPNSTTVPVSSLQIGQAVQKYGRTTGLTQGTIQGLNATIGVDYGSGHIAYFRNQIMITPGSFSAGGDSGSLIVTDDADCNPVGLLFAGSNTETYANPINLVLGEFGVTIDGR